MAAVSSNDLDASTDNPLGKYGLSLHVVAEPQDADGNIAGLREGLPVVQVPLADALARQFTAGGITASGAQIMALFNEVVDHYKGAS